MMASFPETQVVCFAMALNKIKFHAKTLEEARELASAALGKFPYVDEGPITVTKRGD